MKTSKISALLFASVLFFSCQKEPKTKKVDFSSTEYKVLVPYDSTTGRPLNMEKDNISPNLLSFINTNLPEGQDLRVTNPGLLNSNTTTDLRVTQASDVYLTFVFQNTDNRNAIAFYTYPKDIKTITYVFPSSGFGTKLEGGDKIKLGRFEAGTTIGLVLLKDAWQPGTGALDNTAIHFCYNDILNPEIDPQLKKHVVLLNYQPENKVLIAFENSDRTTPESDHDFNDVVLYATMK
jgi:hypothetical protein